MRETFSSDVRDLMCDPDIDWCVCVCEGGGSFHPSALMSVWNIDERLVWSSQLFPNNNWLCPGCRNHRVFYQRGWSERTKREGWNYQISGSGRFPWIIHSLSIWVSQPLWEASADMLQPYKTQNFTLSCDQRSFQLRSDAHRTSTGNWWPWSWAPDLLI